MVRAQRTRREAYPKTRVYAAKQTENHEKGQRMKTLRLQTIIDTARQLEQIALNCECWELAGRAKAIYYDALSTPPAQPYDRNADKPAQPYDRNK